MPSVPGDAWSPPAATLPQTLAAAAAAAPSAVALRFEGADVSYATLHASALRRGSDFVRDAGARPGDRAALVLPNCPEFVASFHGALSQGLVVTPAGPHLPAPELAPLLADADPRVIVCDTARRDAVDAALRRAGLVGRHVVAVDPAAPLRPGDVRDAVAAHAASPSDLAVLQYTSGTTGGLKAAEMTHRNLVANAAQNNVWFSWGPGDVVLGALPLCHTWGLSCVLNASIAARARIVLLRSAEPAATLRAIADERVTIAYGSATFFHRLLDAAGPDAPRALATLRYVKAGAMLVGGDLYERWTAAVPGVPMVNGYGLTEASPEVTNNPPHARRPGTVGLPLPGTQIRLGVPDDPESEAPPGAEGEVQVRGPQVCRGYWRRPDATAAAFTSSGWLRTGDLAAFDEAGYLVIRDRLKDLIKFRGWSVVPGEVERALREHPDVAEAAVVGVPHRVDGEVPVAYLVLRSGCDAPGEAALRAHLDARIARHAHPRRFSVVSEIPKNHVGKPLRRVLRERAAAEA